MNPITIDRGLRAQCRTIIHGHGLATHRAYLQRLMQMPELDWAIDEYNAGPAVTALQDQVAGLLGKPQALFYPKAVVGQQAILLAHREWSGRRLVALHPQSHIACDESDAIERLSDIRLARIGRPDAPFTLADLRAVSEPLAAVVIELPPRNAGFLAPDWDELVAISTWCREQGVPLHLDGARLWEVQPWYGRPLAEIAALADSVYVSLYKGLGAPGGSVIAGPAELLARTIPWRSRMGGNLYTAFPYVLGGLDGLRRYLPRMGDYFAYAQALEAALRARGGPAPLAPVTCNSFRLIWPVPAAALAIAAEKLAREQGVWLLGRVVPLPVPGHCFTEMVVGEAAMHHDPADLADRLDVLCSIARALSVTTG